ncbi:MAG: discoidin domain-containing protein [Sedimentisphaerales bacterium]|nr:discoidin domain-containing protein [Sedimentisphaerales bacterium]
MLCFNDDWRFAKGELPGAEAADFDDSGWERIRVPHDWAICGPFNANENGYAGKLPWKGVGWYRKTFRLDAADKGKRVYFDFDGVMAFPEVYINGRSAGGWDYGYMAFRVDATEFVRFDKANIIAVRADTRQHGTRWYPGAGIYRKVSMTVAEPVHIAHWGTFVTTPTITNDRATINISTTVESHCDDARDIVIAVEIIDPAGRKITEGSTDTAMEAGSTRQMKQTLTVRRPIRWDVDNPQLYRLRTTLSGSGGTLDTCETFFGIRTFEFTANDGFHLNDRRVQLYGVNLHHDQGPLGAAFYLRAAERQLEIMKDMGCNALRTSHNPPAAEMLDLCDRMGILVWDECFDKWNETSDRSRETDLVAHNKKQLQNFIMRDRNHPSVVTWSLGNEIADIESNRSGRADEQVGELAQFVKSLDPTRPVGMGCYVPSAVGTGVLGSLDMTGWNYARRYAPFREKYPDKPIVYSESASALSTRGFYRLPPANTKTQYAAEDLQVDSYDLNAAPWSDIADKEFQLMSDDAFVAGEFVWTGFDYLGEPTPFAQAARSSYFGIVDLCGIPKDRFYLYRSCWREDETTVHIVPHWNWLGREGQNVPVFVYTNGDSAELFINGRSLGRRTKGHAPDRPKNFAASGNVSASSEESARGNTAALACDGDSATRWCAENDSPDQWWQVDLGTVQSVRWVAVEFEKEEKNYGYDVRISSDGETWETVASKARSGSPQWAGPQRAFHEVDTKARFVRIQFTNLARQTWASIREFGVYSRKVESEYYDATYRYRLRWNEVLFEPGKLEAVAYKDNTEIGRKVVLTTGEAAALRLTPDRTKPAATGEDLSYVLVEAVDTDGRVCPLAENLVRFKIEGPCTIAGVGNGNPLSLEPFCADYRKLFYGKAMLILRTESGKAGTIRVTAESQALQPATTVLHAVKQ